MLRDAARDGVKGLMLRAGDFFGPAAPNSALGWLTLRSRRPGALRLFARAASASATPSPICPTWPRPWPACWTAKPIWPISRASTSPATGWRGATIWRTPIRRASGDARIPILPFPYPLVVALSPFNETLRELLEMRYLWRRPIGLDNAKLRAFLGDVPSTPLDAAIRATLADMGCLPQAHAPQGSLALA